MSSISLNTTRKKCFRAQRACVPARGIGGVAPSRGVLVPNRRDRALPSSLRGAGSGAIRGDWAFVCPVSRSALLLRGSLDVGEIFRRVAGVASKQ